ncbi:MAG TPA: copper-binding protein [Pyrinomonadaceae bacterium]|jgi:Cu/Ag efflux protein CusF|nr:copper-binding protein [Pyrinomonadaceae bacterium]
MVIRNSKSTHIFISLCALFHLTACTKQLAHKDSEPGGPAAAVQTKTYPGVGIVKDVDPKLPMIEIDHEDIKGLMPAMQMQFHVKDKALLNGIAVGDRIEFTLENGVGGLRIVAIHKV